jgi:large subunit ribosomal protein L31
VGKREVKPMKANIHPEYKSTVARCACGNEFEVGSTKENIRVEICSKCHPFYTGNRSRIVDTTGRVDRFKKKYGLQ